MPRYFEPIVQFPLCPIRSDSELDRAIAMTESLTDIAVRNADEEDYLQVLGDLIHQYEQAEHPIPRATDAELLQHLIESHGVSPAELAEATGMGESAISLILSGELAIDGKNASAFSRYFHVDPTTFSSETEAF